MGNKCLFSSRIEPPQLPFAGAGLEPASQAWIRSNTLFNDTFCPPAP